MKVLIIGGTRFLGRHLVDAALAGGHEVTLFHRGQTNPGIFPELEHLLADRSHDLSPLRGRRWDAVIDTCGYTPPAVEASTRALEDSVDHYTFISTISVYRHPLESGAGEDAPVALLPEGAPVDVMTFETYGELKVLCERQVESTFGTRSLIVRSGLLVGPHDPTDRFTYWVDRIAAGGDVLAPGSPDRQVQLVHARDLSDWVVGMVERGRSGVFNATGPAEPLSMGELLHEMRRTLGSHTHLEWTPEEFLIAEGVTPWSDLPLWLPDADNSFMQVSVAKALDAGLSFRPIDVTIRETHEWHAGRDVGPLKAGLPSQREAELLKSWRKTAAASAAAEPTPVRPR